MHFTWFLYLFLSGFQIFTMSRAFETLRGILLAISVFLPYFNLRDKALTISLSIILSVYFVLITAPAGGSKLTEWIKTHEAYVFHGIW